MRKLSIIIPTFNRCELLKKVLDSLALLEIDFSIMEVIIVDDGSRDETSEMITARKDPYECRLIKHDQSQGPAVARNHGAREAKGEILGFLDSDIIIDSKWWQAAAPHFENVNVAGVEGATISLGNAVVPTPFTHIVSNTKGGNFLTCNILYRKDLFLEIGGFDQRFLRANREDTDLAFSFLERNLKIVFEPQSIVRHPIVESKKTVYFKEARYGLHEALLRRKHPLLYKRYLKWIDGRAFPVFYWGIYLGLPLTVISFWQNNLWLFEISLILWLAGWSGSVYAVCRKRQFSIKDLIVLIPQYLLLPWIRLYWVLRGEWKYRKIQP